MIVKGIIKKGEYFDSVTLMTVAKNIAALDDVSDAAIVMGTNENKSILASSVMLLDEFKNASDTDLLIAIKAANEDIIKKTLSIVDEQLKKTREKKDDSSDFSPKSLEGAVKNLPEANIEIISIAGRYAGDEAMKAIDNNLHVMLFSDNIPIEKERELKLKAQEKGLLVMGPDCGTAIINGIPLAFSNAVNRGDIGLVAASGTGLQEVISIISNEGGGISQAIGTGGRDVKKEIGGIMFIEGIKALIDDPATKVIVLVSKPPHKDVLKKIADTIKGINKPVVSIFLGGDPATMTDAGAYTADTLEQAALYAVALSKDNDINDCNVKIDQRNNELIQIAGEKVKLLKNNQKYLRGLFSGGTFCEEAQHLMKDSVGYVYSNSPLSDDFLLKDSWKSIKNTIVDLGGDEFTVGRPHPMIDFSLRNRRIIEEAKDPETAVILLDVVLGYGSNMTPAEELVPVIAEANSIAKKDNRDIIFVASVTGTEHDPQNRRYVTEELSKLDVVVMPSNAAASLLTSNIIKEIRG